MGLRHWFRAQVASDAEGNDVPPGTALVNTLLGRHGERVRSLGEYDSQSFPTDLRDLLCRREEVALEIRKIDIADPSARIAAIPGLQQVLRRYPHPLAYETLIHAYLDAGRFDEAKGVAFAARERRNECARSPHPEIRSEIENLRAWSIDEIDELRREREAAAPAPE
jgi:hypothetical protein